MENSRFIPNPDGTNGGLMITNHGAHPPEFYAQVCAQHIAPINPDMTGKRRIAAVLLQAKIAEVLEPHHTDACNLNLEHAHETLPELMGQIEEAAKGTEWEHQYQFVRTKPSWLDAYNAEVARFGAEHLVKATMDGLFTPLSKEQQDEADRYNRYCLIAAEVGRHLASAMHEAAQYEATAEKDAN